jgi:membrane-bound lytic murein transglycosylase A
MSSAMPVGVYARGFGKRARRLALVCMAVLLASCASHGPAPVAVYHPPAGGAGRTPLAAARLTRVSWQQVDGWQDDSLIGAAAALRANCSKLARQNDWARACAAAGQIDELDPASARSFFEGYFTPYQLANDDGSVQGLVTGYYEPELHGARVRHAPYLYPLYRWPAGYARGAALPERGRLIQSGMLSGAELVYVDDPIEAFFLQIQGSGQILMEDGSVLRLGFGGTNGQPYRSIGSWLIEHRELSPAQASMQGIKNWARMHPGQVEALLDVNPRFVFFKEMPGGATAMGEADGPVGALGVPLTPQRSIAVDPASIPLGMPVFLSTTRPLTNQPLNQLVFAQDVGSAIKGGVRADFFWGLGDAAGDLAGKMKQSGRMWLLLPSGAY